MYIIVIHFYFQNYIFNTIKCACLTYENNQVYIVFYRYFMPLSEHTDSLL